MQDDNDKRRYWEGLIEKLSAMPPTEMVGFLREYAASEMRGLQGVESLPYAQEALSAYAEAIRRMIAKNREG